MNESTYYIRNAKQEKIKRPIDIRNDAAYKTNNLVLRVMKTILKI